MNATIRKFGHPATLLREWDHWVVLLRPAQPTLGSMVLAAKSEATAFADLPPAAFAELALATHAIEHVLSGFVRYAKLNYLMLMMVDPHVHFHVIPRYEGARNWGGMAFPDKGWPAVPALGEAVALDGGQRDMLVGELRAAFAALD